MPGFKGYAGRSLDFLREHGLEVGDRIRATAGGVAHEGIVMPRYESDEAGGGGRLVIKLASGYNVGVEVEEIEGVEKAGAGEEAGAVEERREERPGGGEEAGGAGLPRILLLSTGGTIASRIDYRTGAVTPAVTAGELSASVPELGRIARVEPRILFSEYSENIEPVHWRRIASELDSAAGGGGEGGRYAGAIVAHGTDTMQYTASYVSFALRGYPLPVAFVGSQRSSDRPSSDAALNLIAAARLIASGRAKRGVYVVMHMDGGDSAAACHLATRVRKCHTSRRDAFRTIGAAPAFVVRHDRGGEVEAPEGGGAGEEPDYFGGAQYEPEIVAGEGAVLVKCHPGYDPAALDHMIEAGRCRAVIFEGTGLGHVGRPLYPTVKRAAERGIFMGMTSQCVEGRVRMTVYESGRDLLAMGIVPLGDMLAETALAKAVWALGREDARGGGRAAAAESLRMSMLEPVASEATPG